MLPSIIFLIFLSHFNGLIFAERTEPHLYSEVRIVGYNGPLAKETLTLFRSVEILEYKDCNFTLMAERLYSLLPKLRKIYCDNVIASNVHPDVALDSTVEEFYYANGTWTEAHLEVWNGFKNLKKLVISGYKNSFIEIKANTFNETKLEYLEIRDSGVRKIDDMAFNNLDGLETLDLAGNELKIISLSQLKNLKTLDLRGNLLESFGSSQLHLPKLENINLSDNPLKNLVLDNIAPNLNNLQISGTFITEQQLEDLKKNFITKIGLFAKTTKELNNIIRF